ncbi:MAG: primosomal protein N' [Lachnospiraceae bacterium]|nr:primosomal protein N' [Lachnospiraceae bacterium]
MLFANIIIDISHEKLDKTFQYIIPENLIEKLSEGCMVYVPFGKGNREIKGYVVEITDKSEYDISKMKCVSRVSKKAVPIESELIALAAWMKRNYGGTMNQALKTVIPVKQRENIKVNRLIELNLSKEEAMDRLAFFRSKHQVARERALLAIMENGQVKYEELTKKINVSAAVVRSLEEQGVIRVIRTEAYRNPIAYANSNDKNLILNEMQQAAVDTVQKDIEANENKVYLLHGVTGSGKTEVYMELIAKTIERKKSAIVLIPEIALTFQTVMRFYGRFKDRVSILNSRMSPGERYDQYVRAREGKIDIMIGPRSALFTPFDNLGLIIIDEEHEATYKSEQIPRYHARETAIERARMAGASVVLGSATPSVDSFYKASKGEYVYLSLKERVEGRALPNCEVVDLREELKSGNRSILSHKLQSDIEERLKKGEQTMLFLNRRGFSGFISCRSCGEVIKCPHCDVSLSLHNNGTMVCHYCGHVEPAPKVCPKCGSKYIGAFKAGTQKIEEIVKKQFPTARVLRMDYDTTRKKDSYEIILEAFANREADILIGTQMIVKGHDFSNVTLVGILAADISLNVPDYHSAERTFQILTQAAGRAGRGEKPGEVILQTYQPEHYSIVNAANQDYESFYNEEITYRKIMNYPPAGHMMVVYVTSVNEKNASDLISILAEKVEKGMKIGPAPASVSRVNDIYRFVMFIKDAEYSNLVEVKDVLEKYALNDTIFKDTLVSFDFDPMSGV